MLGVFWAKVAPRAGETLENTRSFVRVGGPKERPRETQNLTKFLDFRPKLVQSWMCRSLGVLLAPFPILVGIRVTRKSRKHSILRPVLTTSRLFQFVNTLYFTAFLTTFGLLHSSSSLRFPRTLMTRPSRKHNNLHTFFTTFWPRKFLSKLF